jgi:hypothetical protein
MEEAWVAVFRNLYTGFLLRDFAGKIVPGTLLLFSLWSLFRPPRTILAEIKNEVPVFVVLLVAGLAWTVTLGTQSLAEGSSRVEPVEVSLQATPKRLILERPDAFHPSPSRAALFEPAANMLPTTTFCAVIAARRLSCAPPQLGIHSPQASIVY